ncbi:MAG TPA: hypothetical protein VF586_13735 [Pyrinomonadaceae bacterium]
MGSIFQNLFAECLGLAIGILIAAIIGRALANEKLEELAPELIRLFARLREDKVIREETARTCVICTVKFLSEDNLAHSRDTQLNLDDLTHCPVCALTAPIQTIPGGGYRCVKCKLRSGVWNVKLDPVETSATSATDDLPATPSK